MCSEWLVGASFVSAPVLFPFDRGDQLQTNMQHSHNKSYIIIFFALLSLNIGIRASENTTQHVNSETVPGKIQILFCLKYFMMNERHLYATNLDHSVQNTTTLSPITTSHLTSKEYYLSTMIECKLYILQFTDPISASSGGSINNGSASPVAINPASNGTAQGWSLDIIKIIIHNFFFV